MKTMRLSFALSISILLFINPVFSLFAEGQAETAAFEQAVEQYRSGELEAAAESFRRAASSAETDYAAAAYYNYGTIQAGLAENTDEVQKKRELLESSYDALKRSADIGTLPAEQDRHARQNMQIVRERLSQLPDEQKREQQDGGGQEGEQQSSQQDGQQQSGQNGQDNGAEGDPLQQQRELREQTESGRGSEQELAQQQKKLQQKSEDAGQNEAALNQQKAAEALRQGDRQRAAEYQKAAEKELESAAAEERDSEAEQIMDREAEQQAQRNRLDKSGGINEADKNW